ncbi:glycosyltransferase [Aridibaculum aurantiacum]|uniref:glycosyltransferase n=1 Tax=Aridibaculum aurantiacum TaxID=2810307 RepID=UPI001A9692DD|nr:glycosyltransferase [Aridibaculum aurantiacum]
MPKVSVIIPAYNCAEFIEKTLASVEAQTYPQKDIEVIIVNDGSTDNTADVLRRYSDYTVIQIPNGGVSNARNTGIEVATGKYIQFLDSDDLLCKGKIEEQVSLLEANNADVAYGFFDRFEEVGGDLKIVATSKPQLSKEPEIDIFKSNFWCPPAALLYSKRIVEKVGGFKTWLPVVEDARFLLDAYLVGGKFFGVSKVVALYRVNQAQSLSQRSRLQFINCSFLNAVDMSKIWKDDKKKLAAVVDAIRFCITEFSLLDYKKFSEAIDVLLKIQPKYVPHTSGPLRILSKTVGYKKAEHFARLKRRLNR